MNWTGGKLQRHSRQNRSTVLQRQKQHFARVRTCLQNANTQPRSPFKPTFLASDDKTSPRRQTKLEDYKTTAPAARRLNSLSPRSDAPCPYHERRNSLTNSKSKSLQKRFHSGPNNVDNDQRQWEASPYQHHKTQGGHDFTERDKFSTDEALEAARRRLLMQSDWVGVQITQPAKIKFTSTPEREQFGRRHKIDKEAQERQQQKQGRRRRIPSIRSDLEIPLRSREASESDEYIQVRIGDDALVSSRCTIEPASAPSRFTDLLYQRKSMDKSPSLMSFDEAELANQGSRRDAPQTSDLLDATSFHDFSDQSSHLRDRLERPETVHSCKSRDVHSSNSKFQMAVLPERLMLSSSEPTTPPVPDTQSNLAVASRAKPTKSDSSSKKPEDTARPLSIISSHERLWRNYLHVINTNSNSIPTEHHTHHIEQLTHYKLKNNTNNHLNSTHHQNEPTQHMPIPTEPTNATVFLSRTPHKPHPRPPSNPIFTHPDPDALWKAFVFGDISSTRVSTVSTPHTSTTQPLNQTAPVVSSLQAHASNDPVTGTDDSSILDYAPPRDSDVEIATGDATIDSSSARAVGSIAEASSSWRRGQDGILTTGTPVKRVIGVRKGGNKRRKVPESSSPDPLTGPVSVGAMQGYFRSGSVDTGRNVVALSSKRLPRI